MDTTLYRKIKGTALIRLLLLLAVMVNGQWSMVNGQTINIGGNVYGGGNAGKLNGNTNVTVYAGNLNNVFGGARMADVGGRTFVNIDAKNASEAIFIVNIYGGNDIAGQIGKSEDVESTVPDELENIKRTDDDATDNTKNTIDNTWKAFVRTTASAPETLPLGTGENAPTVTGDSKMFAAGDLFGGGNGDYIYSETDEETGITTDLRDADGNYIVRDADGNTVATSKSPFTKPELSKTYLEIKGGCIAHVYGGGNNATVTEATTINIDNSSCDLESTGTAYAVRTGNDPYELLALLRAKMNMADAQSDLSSWAFTHARVFGGNNKASMHIMPKWNLQKGIIRDLYSGGNEGHMLGSNGIFLEISPTADNSNYLVIDNVFGGCRKADVHPIHNGQEQDHVYSPQGYSFPQDLAARVVVNGGDINNVYGGNDISGKVYFGSAVGLYTDIRGNLYGGGNGSYAYTDNAALKDELGWSDFYYNPDEVLRKAGITDIPYPEGMTVDTVKAAFKSAYALNFFRPNAEQVSLRIAGKSATEPIIIGGSVFVGGNSATLKADATRSKAYQKEAYYPIAELKIGSYVIADKVFLGNNGERMIDASKDGILETYASIPAGVPANFNKMDLKNEDVFAEYMDAVTMEIVPSVKFDNYQRDQKPDYVDYSASIGSFYCGGNVGSMRSQHKVSNITFDHKVIIFDKLVGGCNNANVPVQYSATNTSKQLNAAYQGGLIGPADADGNKLILNLSGLKIQPKRWAVQREGTTGVAYNTKSLDANGNVIYLKDDVTHKRYLEWNTIDASTYNTKTKKYNEVAPVTTNNDIPENGKPTVDDDLNRRLFGGNIYGGCYSSGIVNGNVVINLDASIIERDKLFDDVKTNEFGEEESLYGTSQTTTTNFTITKRNTGVILAQQGMDVFGASLNVFGGGKGRDTEIWGSSTINLNRGYTFQIFGGSEEGTIGKPTGASTAADLTYTTSGSTLTYSFNGKKYEYNPAYSCYVNLKGTVDGVSKAENQREEMAECEFMYGGGFFGPICGNTIINMGSGRIFNSFAGSCNADILGHAETYIGRQIKNVNKNIMGKLGNTVVSTASDGTQTFTLDNDSCYQPGFTWIRDITYGANDLGGRIFGSKDFTKRVRKASDAYGLNVLDMVHKSDTDGDGTPDKREVLVASAYTEYLQGRADAIFGGCYGTYNFKDQKFERYTDSSTGEPLLDGTAPLFYKPRLDNAFVNFRPTYYNKNNVVKTVYGAGQGQSGETDRDKMQDRSYVLIDIPQIAGTAGTTGDSESTNFNKYSDMEVFGAGAWGGIGMRENLLPVAEPTKPAAGASEETFNTYNSDLANYKSYLSKVDKQSAIIDLVRGDIGAAYGASYKEGVTRRTLVNVPQGSTIKIGSIFGGGYGTETYKPCDVYEAHVEYHSPDAVLVNNRPRVDANGNNLGNPLMLGAIYGGNNNQRRTLYGFINIDVPVRQSHYQYGMTTANVYGAGYGSRTWNEYTQIDLKNGANVYEVYGGGEAGGVMNAESVAKYYVQNPYNIPTDEWKVAWTLGSSDYDPADFTAYHSNTATNLDNPLTRRAEMDDRSTKTYKYNTNVIIHEGAYVGNYAYAGGFGMEEDKFAGSGDVYGTTYLALLGGTVNKDIYAAGTSGAVYDLFGAENFTASANAYIKGGTVRNVYGGGWRGSVGYHSGSISHIANMATDRDGEAHVVIGDIDGTDHVSGIPSITRNVYGGGEGGAIFGDAYVTVNNGYIGYRYNSTLTNDQETELDDRYVPELDDTTPGDNDLDKGGNVFGGGYVANSYVDRTHINMWDGIVRGSLYGGGEIGPVGRGTVHADTLTYLKSLKNLPTDDPKRFDYTPYIKHDYGTRVEGCQPAAIYKGGETHVYLWGGHVMRDVFGGGRGYDNWNGEGYFQSQEEKDNMDRSSKGYVFGTTDVHIRGGEIGTEAGVLLGYGNVFGGGNEGYVYSATGVKTGEQESDNLLVNGVPATGGGFYYVNPVVDNNGNLTSSDGLSLDCNITVEPYCKVTATGGISGFTANATTGVKASYAKDEYVPVEALNQLQNRNKDQAGPKKWDMLDARGITIHNAIFAGGNITEGSDNLFANTTTVYGNTAASLRDVYNYDLISLGTEEMGGLYGDGNLTLVDGFRELHIDNYGTDYYSLKDALELDEYNTLSERQKAYYKLKYVTAEEHTFYYWECKELHTYNDISYKRGQKISSAEYEAIPETFTMNGKEVDKVKYWTRGRKTFQKDDKIEESEYILMYGDEQSKWTLFGVTNIYDGRPLNTIQRADMCGVFGSRMVLKGAEDRVVNTVDYHLYTINRVDEVSLNKRVSQAGDTDEKDMEHGNYFGIFSDVNYLGNLTSDVFFDDVRKTDSNIEENKDYKDPVTGAIILKYGTASYYDWKAAKPQAKNRNNGISHNKVALASGVYLEIKRQEGEMTGIDDWGYITGVVQLDLINVMQGMGGGYVYARNEHGKKEYHGPKDNPESGYTPWGKVTLLNYNNEARTYRHFKYIQTQTSSGGDTGGDGARRKAGGATDLREQIETSGNFVHNTKQIVDDCYPHGGIYKDGYVKSPAHYWFIRGSIYVYDQYISAYTGSANAYAETVEMPLTISAAANGRMTLREVQPNYYAYYDKNGNKLGDKSQGTNADETIIINNTTYQLNDAVSYWDYRLMSDAEKARFVEETYVVIDSCKIGEKFYPAGYVMLPSEYDELQDAAEGNKQIVDSGEDAIAVPAVQKATIDENGNNVAVLDDNNHPVYSAFSYVFRPSNNLSTETGYVLTYDVNNPMVWNNYYTLTKNKITEKIGTELYNDYKEGKKTIPHQGISLTDYIEGPTFTPKAGMTSVYGQEQKKQGDIIPGKTKKKYDEEVNVNNHIVLYPAVAVNTKLTAGQTYCTSPNGDGKFTANGSEVAGEDQYYIYNKQAVVTEQAYVVTKEYSVKNDDGTEKEHLNPGTPIYYSSTNYTAAQWKALTGETRSESGAITVTGTDHVAVPAKVCTTLLDFSATDYVYAGKLMTAEKVDSLKKKVIAKYNFTDDPAETTNGKTKEKKAEEFLATCFDDAYYCTEEGLYGGIYYETGKAYSAIESWCSMTADERKNFDFNYDALDLLVDPTYDNRDENNYGYKPQYDGWKLVPEYDELTGEVVGERLVAIATKALNPQIYSAQQPIDYKAECTTALSYYEADGTTSVPIDVSASEDDWLSRTAYEAIPNDKHFFSPITVTTPGYYYVVNTVCMEGDVPYTVGQVIDDATYTSMSNKENVTKYYFTEEQTGGFMKDDYGNVVKDELGNNLYNPITYFYCREGFRIGKKGGYKANQFKGSDDEVKVSTTPVKETEESEAPDISYYWVKDSIQKEVIINQENFEKLCNDQRGFIIHGVSPTEVSTLYVSSESDIHDLSSEKIITVIYLYEYEESDESGNNVVPVSERHIVNIHINFKSGVPEIGNIKKPDIVLPGTTIGMDIPSVSQGAYRVTESGWEIFDTQSNALTHTNGSTYINNTTPVYWYQNNYWIAYYAQTYLGKTYSNSVPISVANYHDLKKVMDDTNHHYYIDHKDVDYEPKIYINDYSSSNENGLDLFKNLIDLTYVESKDADGNPVAISGNSNTDLNGHMPLDLSNTKKQMQGGKYLEFFLRANQDHGPTTKPNPYYDENDPDSPKTITEEHPWTPIASGTGQCFEGILHGDGHTISGLAPNLSATTDAEKTGSLFSHLCGEVYNLGVTGSFTGAGIVDTGEGYVENCWMKSTSTAAKTARPVFGDPQRDENDAKGLIQVVNCYYLEDDAVAFPTGGTTPADGSYTKRIDDANDSKHGTPIRRGSEAFYNGEVAYDLNGFYLYKRYTDQTGSVDNDDKDNRYYTIAADNTLTLQPYRVYGSNPTLCSSGYVPTGAESDFVSTKYVEDRYADGDFIYADGTIPGSADERLYVNPETKEEEGYYPIWPDDYIFFGQALNYGYMDGKNGRDLRTHQDLPSVIHKSSSRLVTDNTGNRVYRAPAYFRSSNMGVAHFNSYAVFAQKRNKFDEANPDTLAYKGMTAIDFTGYNDVFKVNDEEKDVTTGNRTLQPYHLGWDGTKKYFYQPLLDDDGVQDFYNADLTSNLLAYTTTGTAAADKTNETVSGYLVDAQLSDYESNDKYRKVALQANSLSGHWVQLTANGYRAARDHQLIDRQDFNAPISYKFDSDYRMWYQREPDTFVALKTGWEAVSLPFSAELVTTNDKGEITHFYSGSAESKNGTGTKVGHEYWLRELTDGATMTEQSAGILVGNFHYPSGTDTESTSDVILKKDVTNTFLWDYYYKGVTGGHNQKDLNNDEYQTYYSEIREYQNYPMLTKGTPYIIGFPGSTYYEFDLSGMFNPQTTAEPYPRLLEAQVITFASQKGTTIHVSDKEMGGVTNKYNSQNYTFKPSYMNESFKAGSSVYTLQSEYDSNSDNKACSSFVIVPGVPGVGQDPVPDTKVEAFRPYFTSSVAGTRVTRSIVFSNDNSQLKGDDDNKRNSTDGSLSAYSKKRKIVVESTLREAAEVSILNTAGITVATFTIQPGETIETSVNISGVYIIQSTDGQYTKKLSVR